MVTGVPAQWVTGDRVYEDARRLRVGLAAQPHADVLAVSGKAYIWLDGSQRQVNTGLAALPTEGWTRLSAGNGRKGQRGYAWCWPPLADPVEPAWRRWLLVRRRVSDPTDWTASVVFAPQQTALADVVWVVGTRWTMESGLAVATREVGLDHDEVRSGTGGDRSITLALWALALLTVLRARAVAGET